MSDVERLDLTASIEQVECAVVGQPRNDELDDRGNGPVQVEGRGKACARLREERVTVVQCLGFRAIPSSRGQVQCGSTRDRVGSYGPEDSLAWNVTSTFTVIRVMNRRTWIQNAVAGGAACLAGLPSLAVAVRPVRMVIYKSPSCGCCKKWVDHVQANGFTTEVHDVDDVAPFKKKHGLPDELASCHTALVEGYVIEGHVPADVVQKLLKEKPALVGLAAPGMPMGSPGMEVGGRTDPYDIIAFDRKGKTSVYAKR
jgi:hypothetical protein